MAEGGFYGIEFPVSRGAEARVTSTQEDTVDLDCRVGHRRCSSEGSWLTSCPTQACLWIRGPC